MICIPSTLRTAARNLTPALRRLQTNCKTHKTHTYAHEQNGRAKHAEKQELQLCTILKILAEVSSGTHHGGCNKTRSDGWERGNEGEPIFFLKIKMKKTLLLVVFEKNWKKKRCKKVILSGKNVLLFERLCFCFLGGTGRGQNHNKIMCFFYSLSFLAYCPCRSWRRYCSGAPKTQSSLPCPGEKLAPYPGCTYQTPACWELRQLLPTSTHRTPAKTHTHITHNKTHAWAHAHADTKTTGKRAKRASHPRQNYK